MPNRVKARPSTQPAKTVSKKPAAKTPAAKAAQVTAPSPKKADARQKDEVQVPAFVAKALKSSAPGPYELVAGRYPDAVGLPQVLEQLGTSPGGQAAVAQLLATLKAKSGIEVHPDVQAALLSNPSAATTAFELRPRQLQNGVLALNAAYQAGKVKPIAPREHLLASGFDLGNIAALDAPRPQPKLKQVAPGLFTGSLPSTLGDAEVKQNRVMAETLDRLSRNASLPQAERFEVKYDGKAYSELGDFLQALKANGHEVTVTFEQRIANFADLKTVVPGSNPPKYLDVPAPLMLRTGIKDAAGKEAVVPAAHSEMIISIASGPGTRGPKLDSQVRYFQGTDGTGFFPRGTSAEPKWLGRAVHGEVKGDDALKAISLAGALGDVIGKAAKDLNLYAEGYGVTGVCNDSVAVVQQALMGRADQYPLLMRDEVLFGELQKRLSDSDRRDDPLYQALSKAIAEVPSDAQSNATLRERALKSLPWEPGQEPFTSTVDARRILSA